MQIRKEQISNFPEIPQQEQIDVLYELVNRILIQLTIQDIELNDELLQEQLKIALATTKI